MYYSKSNKLSSMICVILLACFIFIEAKANYKVDFSEDGKILKKFSGFYVTEYTIPNGVTTIAPNAFTAPRLQNVLIPNTVINIGDFAFYFCSKLYITIPSSVKYIGESAFCGVRQIKSENDNFVVDSQGVLIDKKNKKILYAPPTLYGNYNIPEGIEIIGAGAFCSLNNLYSVTIPSSVITIAEGSFMSCKNLEEIKISNNVINIGRYAFSGCKKLNITIPHSVKNIGESAFCDVRQIKSENNNFTIDSNGVLIDKKKKELLYSPPTLYGSYNIPEGIEVIGAYAFSNNRNLQKVVIPKGVTRIKSNAFGMCFNLQNVLIPDSVIFIGDRAFNYCINLNSVVIPKKAQIGKNAFDAKCKITKK